MSQIHGWGAGLRPLWFVLLSLLCPALACGPTAAGAITPDGYEHKKYEYRVAALSNGELMPEGWLLDNFYREANQPLKPKNGEAYVAVYDLDLEGDGEYETSRQELAYDLRFKHREHDGVIFVRTVPISNDLKDKKLSVLIDRYVDQIAGAGYEVVTLGAHTKVVVEKRYAAAVVDKRPATLAGNEAYVVTADIANLDRLKVDPEARSERVQVVLLHTDFRYEVGRHSPTPVQFPVVMYVGYANQPDEFNAGLPEFHEFLARISVAGRHGFAADASELTSVGPPSEEPASAQPSPGESGPDGTLDGAPEAL